MLLHKRLLYSVCGVFVLSFPLSLRAQSRRQATGDQTSTITAALATSQSPSVTATDEGASAELPDSPGAVRSQAENPSLPQTSSSSAAEQQQQTDPGPPPTPSPQSQGAAAPAPGTSEMKQQRPVGTAAAETPMVSGTTAAQPAGFAIAPAKQHRTRTLVLKVGAIAGVAVALGTTMALTMATPSKPPGAH